MVDCSCKLKLLQLICHVVMGINHTLHNNVSCFYRACCRCANLECGSEYDMDFIEIQLIDMVQKLSMAFVLQDLKCTKCRGVC